MKHILHIFILLVASPLALAQDTIVNPIEDDYEYFIIKGDTIAQSSIGLDEVFVFKKLKFKNKQDRRRYLILRRKTRKVYPYAKLAADRLTMLNHELAAIKRKSAKKRHARKVNKFLEKEFSAELKKLTRTEGQILIKLIHRQTGSTTFDLIKNLRSGWRAFWYNTTAKAFKISLKEVYDPANVEEDYLIEDILQRSFQSKILERQKTALDFEYLELTNKWDATTAVQN